MFFGSTFFYILLSLQRFSYNSKDRKRKRKKEYLYSGFIAFSLVHLNKDHTVLPANYTMPAFPSSAFTRWPLHWMWWRTYNCSSLLIYRPREDDRLSWLGWLNYSGRLPHICGHPSATGWVQDGERTLARDWRSTAEPRRTKSFLKRWYFRSLF